MNKQIEKKRSFADSRRLSVEVWIRAMVPTIRDVVQEIACLTAFVDNSHTLDGAAVSRKIPNILNIDAFPENSDGQPTVQAFEQNMPKLVLDLHTALLQYFTTPAPL